jgi:BirA family transcriptional regulator, biotin operon repressor / biotin---[acetyl-CoA-carboxylase] ligase
LRGSSAAHFSVPVIELDETISTNVDAIARVSSGAFKPPFWVKAERQTGGKGRDGRHWVSTPGNLYASLTVPLDCEIRVAPQLSLVAGIAVIDAVRVLAAVGNYTPDSLQLKWPNDILFGKAKCGGILIETAAAPQTKTLVAVIGIGLNIVSHPAKIDREVTHLAAQGIHTTVHSCFACVAQALDAALRLWDFGRGFNQVRASWLASATPLGTPMRIHAGYPLVEGTFAGLDFDGALLLQDAEHVKRFSFGDVVLMN